MHRDLFDQLQAMLKPLAAIPKFEIPSNIISVAVHIRKGEGYDVPLLSAQIYKNVDKIFRGTQKQEFNGNTPSDRNWPSKFPPEQYYIDQINILADLLADKKIIFYIFSDCQDPLTLTSRIAEYCKKDNIAIVNAASSLKESPIIDLCKIASCDCLIRPQSSYSIVSQIMGNHKIVFSPHRCEWRNNILYVPQVKITMFNSKKNDSIEFLIDNCDKNLIKQWLDELFSH